jgi:hypothetical protein
MPSEGIGNPVPDLPADMAVPLLRCDVRDAADLDPMNGPDGDAGSLGQLGDCDLSQRPRGSELAAIEEASRPWSAGSPMLKSAQAPHCSGESILGAVSVGASAATA